MGVAEPDDHADEEGQRPVENDLPDVDAVVRRTSAPPRLQHVAHIAAKSTPSP